MQLNIRKQPKGHGNSRNDRETADETVYKLNEEESSRRDREAIKSTGIQPVPNFISKLFSAICDMRSKFPISLKSSLTVLLLLFGAQKNHFVISFPLTSLNFISTVFNVLGTVVVQIGKFPITSVLCDQCNLSSPCLPL